MKLTEEKARDIVWDDDPEWIKIEKKITGQNRWSVSVKGIFQHKKTNKYYMTSWRRPATECQEELPFEYEGEVEFVEVHQVEKRIKVWEPIK